DCRVIEVACHRAIDVPHEEAYDLIVDLGAPQAFGDLRIELFGVESGTPDRRQIDMAPHRSDRTERDARAGKLDEEIALPAALGLLLFSLVLELAPRVRWQVLETPGIPRVGGHGLRRVVVAQRDVIPLLGCQQLARQLGAAVFDRATFLCEPQSHAASDWR